MYNSPPANPISLSQSTNNTTLRPFFVRSTRSPVKRKLKHKRRNTTRFRSSPSSADHHHSRSQSNDDHLFETESPVLSTSSINASPLLTSMTFEPLHWSTSLVHLIDNFSSSEYGACLPDSDKKLVPISVTLSNKVFCIGCQSGEILIFHPVTFILLKCMLGHVRAVLSLSIINWASIDTLESNNSKLISTSADGTTRVWDLSSFSVESVIVAADPGSIYGSATDMRSKTMYLACQNASLQWFNRQDTDEIQARSLLKTREFSYFFQPRTLESFLTDTELKKNDLQPPETNNLQVHLISDTQIIAHAHMGYIYTALTHPTLPKLYTGSGDGLVKVWDTTNTKPTLTHVIHVQSGTVYTLDTVDLQCAELVGVDDAAVISLAISPSGACLYVGCQRGTIMVWDLDTMQCIRRLVEHEDHIVGLFVISTVVPNHDDNNDEMPQAYNSSSIHACSNRHDLRLVSASSDGSIRIWALHDNYECLASINSIFDGNSDQDPRNKQLEQNSLVSVALYETRIAVIDTRGKCMVWEAHDDLLTPKSAYFINQRVASPLQVGSDLELHACSSTSSSLSFPDIQLGIQLDPALHMVEAMLFALRNWIPYQTISGNPMFNYQCRAGAKYLKSVLSQLGADTVLVPGAEGRNPLVVGKFTASQSSAKHEGVQHGKHLIFYGHYDVVPAEPSQWVTDPWQLVGRNGYLYGRGVSDDKGPILAAIFAVAELASTNQLTSTVTFIIEGEEESGSVGLSEAIDKHTPLIFGTSLKADIILMSNSSWLGMKIPCLVYGQRGVVHVTVTVDGADQHDRHAGVEGGVYHHEPLSDLVYLLAQLTNSGCSANGNTYQPVQIPGFYQASAVAQDVISLDGTGEKYSDLTARIIDKEDSSVLKQIQGTNSMGETTPKLLQSALVKKWLTPTLTISRITTSMGNQEGKTVIPHRAMADISMRTIPGQSTAELVDTLQVFLNKKYAEIQRCSSHMKNMNRIEIEVTTAADAWESDPMDPSFKACACAIRRIWKCDPIYVREGGSTIPLFWLRNRLSNRDKDGTQNTLPVVNLPLAQADDQAHLSNEQISIEHLIRGRLIFRECILELQKL